MSAVALNNKPTVQVVVGGISGAKSTISFATPTVAVGSTDLITISVADSNGNPIVGLASNAFSFALSGKSVGKFGSVSPSAIAGTYTVVFTGTKKGTASTLTAKVSGVTLSTKPKVRVVAGAVSGAKSKVVVATPTVFSGVSDTVSVTVKNSDGDPITGLASPAFKFGLSRGKSAGTFGAVSANATPGIYTVDFTGTTPGTASIVTAKVRGVRINSKPKLYVIASTVTAAISAS